MNDLKKLTIIIIRLQSVSLVLVGLIQWGILATMLLITSLKSQPSEVSNFEAFFISSVFYFIVGVILWARSKSLANYFIRGVPSEDNQI